LLPINTKAKSNALLRIGQNDLRSVPIHTEDHALGGIDIAERQAASIPRSDEHGPILVFFIVERQSRRQFLGVKDRPWHLHVVQNVQIAMAVQQDLRRRKILIERDGCH
jgi:hypothetical protein